MATFFQNPPNRLLAEKPVELHAEYTRVQWILIAIAWAVLFPVCLPLWLIWKLLCGAAVASGMVTFWLAQRLFVGPPDTAAPFRWQCVRAYINNSIASRLPHWNSPFRRFLFRLTGVRIGRGGFIGMNGYMEDYLPQNVLIEDDVIISFGVCFIAHGVKAGRSKDEKYIILRKGAYIGAAAVLLPGIEIGEGAVVGAGSVVTRDVPAGAIVAGSPARILKPAADTPPAHDS